VHRYNKKAGQEALQIIALQPTVWALVIGVSFVATLWIELKKMFTGRI
jgi:hypothetical protein